MLTTAQAAERLHTSRRVVQRWIKAGRLVAVKHGRDWMIDESDVARFERRTAGRRKKAE